jgi:hypothetical protein
MFWVLHLNSWIPQKGALQEWIIQYDLSRDQIQVGRGGLTIDHYPPTTVFTVGVVKLADALDLKSCGAKLEVNIRLI